MTIEDYDGVYRLWSTTPGMGLNDVDDSRDGVERFLVRNPLTCFVAEQDGDITGAIMSGHDGRRGVIYHTAVAADRQRKGIGSALVRAALDALNREGISKVLLVVFARNEKGNAFWERLGFTARTDLVYRDKALRELVRTDT
jgi:Acetyltransferases